MALTTRSAPTARRTEYGHKRDTVGDLARRMLAEYRELPGLSLTLPQAQRLWAVDRQACESALARLLSNGLIRRTRAGRFVLAGGLSARWTRHRGQWWIDWSKSADELADQSRNKRQRQAKEDDGQRREEHERDEQEEVAEALHTGFGDVNQSRI